MPATTGPKPPRVVPIPPTTPRGPGQPELPRGLETVAPRSTAPPAARVPVELLELIRRFDDRVSALEAMTEVPGPPGVPGRDGLDGTDGKDADCSVLAGQVKALTERVKALEAAVQMPIYLHKRNMITGEETTEEVRLGEGFTFKLYPHQN